MAAAFKVDLVTPVKFKLVAWKTKRSVLAVGANVTVGDGGEKDGGEEGIQLKSSAPGAGCGYINVVGTLVSPLVSMIFILSQ